MKTIKNEKETIKRVSDEEARKLVSSGTWIYVPKSEWKKSTNYIKKPDMKKIRKRVKVFL
jgi:hypothetical protein